MSKSPDPDDVPALGFHGLTPHYDVVVGAIARERLVKQVLIAQARFEPGQQVLGRAVLGPWRCG